MVAVALRLGRGALPAVAVATLAPLVLFYTVMAAASVMWAIGAVVGYAWAMSAWQCLRQHRVSGMLLVTVLTSTFRAAVALVSGHTILYFAIPVLETTAFGLMFVVTLVGTEPLVVRFTRDLVPGAVNGLSDRRALVRSLSLVWAATYLGNAATTALLLAWTPLSVFLAAHVAAGWIWTLAAAVVSVMLVRRRAAGLFSEVLSLHPKPPVPATVADAGVLIAAA
jgi:hypothetical protein